MDISRLSIKDSWFLSKECKKLTETVEDLIKNDELDPADIEVINSSIPDEHQEEFWDNLMAYYDKL